MTKEITQNETSIAHDIGFNEQQIAILKETAFKDLKNSAERGAALMICSKYKLDPFAKEFYAYANRGQVITVIGYQGWLTIIKRHEGFKQGSLILNAVYENDTIEIDFTSGEVDHKSNVLEIKDDEDPKGAYCSGIINGQRVTKYVRWSEYTKKGMDSFNPWNKQKSEMICAKAAAVFGRVYCGVHGVYAEGEVELESSKGTTQTKLPKSRSPEELVQRFKDRKKEVREEKEKDKAEDAEIVKETT